VAEIPELRAIVDRNALAVVAGNFMQIMADVTPEALAKLMGMAGSGQPSVATLPAISGYDVELLESEGGSERYLATFRAAAGTAQIVTHWQQVAGAWKIVDVSGVELTPAAEGA
jgi:hypothetical protein